MNLKKTFLPLVNPLSKDNPVIVQVLGICSALAVTAKMEPAIVMSISVTAVLALANVIISLMRKTIPQSIRIIVQLVVVAALVVIVDQVLKAWNYEVSKALSVFIGLIIMFYLLLDEEKFKHQVKKLAYGAFPEKAGDEIMYVGRLSVRMFNSFIAGKAVDSLIIGIVCWLVVTILQMPYAPMIGFIVGITNMIPVFGPFIGAIPCLIILLIINPWQSLEFLIFIIILQQIDGNIIGPHILGDSMGLPTLWVMFAIIVGGALFGVVGMFLGVPIFSVIYTLVANALNRRMMENQIDLNTK